MVIWLVVGPTPLKNMKVKWEGLFHIWNGTIIQMFQTTNQVNSNEISIWIVTYCDIFWHIVTYFDPFPWTIRRVYSNFTQTHVVYLQKWGCKIQHLMDVQLAIKVYRQQNHVGLSRNGGRTKHRSENDDHWWILRGPQFQAIPRWKVSMKWWIYHDLPTTSICLI